MFAIPGLCALLVFIYLRPQEVVPALDSVPFLYLFVLLAVAGLAIDVRLGWSRLRINPLIAFGAGHFLWSAASLLVVARAALAKEAIVSFVSCFLFIGLAQSIQTFRALKVVAATLLAVSLALAAVGLHQSQAPLGCVRQDELDLEVWHPDGRACATRADCTPTAVDAGTRYRCEHIGLAGTTSVEGRVRYRGIMEDPNELALVVSISLPFAFVFFQTRRSVGRLILTAAVVMLIGLCTIATQSRSGQLAFLAVLGAYLFRRLRWAGVITAAVLALPVLLLGGRADQGADQSTLERLECWSVAIELWRSSPLFGVGKGQFGEHHYLTAHNSFLLALAELGLPGLFLWSSTVFLAFRTAITVALRPPALPETASMWATALVASLCGLCVSASFLSLTDHNVLWIYLGLAAALISVIQRHAPHWRLRLRIQDAAIVLIFDLGLVAAVFVYTRMHGV